MQREYAEAGSVLRLYDSDGAEKRFTITETKGEGGSSLVYCAKTRDGFKSVIKEFFPVLSLDYSFSRRDGELYIEKSISVTEEYLLKAHRFVSSASVMNRLAFSEETAEETLAAKLFSNQNGIPYIVTEWNPKCVSCYEDVKTESLNEISTVCLHLAEIISSYHNMGLVHLDIKPSNILWSKKYHYIKLFDFDTMDIAENTVKSHEHHGTDGYDAPEVADRGAVNTKADVYSIGAILFERIMGRNVNSLVGDRVSFGYEKDLPARPLMANESPEAAALVKKILRGTICAAPGRRMRNDSLTELLRQLCTLTRSGDEQAAHTDNAAGRKRSARITAFLPTVLLAAAGVVLAAGFFGKAAADKNEPVKPTDQSAALNAEISAPEINGGTAADIMSAEPTEQAQPQPEQTSAASSSAFIDAPPESDVDSAQTEPASAASVRTTAQTAATTIAAAVSSSADNTAGQPEENYSDGFSYRITDGGIELTEYSGGGGAVVIPASIDGYRVVKLGDHLFADRRDISSLTIPEGVKELGEAALWFCTGLTELKLPQSTEILRTNSLYGLSGVNELYIPENVSEIEDLCFGWSGYEKIEVSGGNQQYSSVDGVLYSKDGSRLLFYPAYKADREFTVPDTVTDIGFFAFDRTLFLEKLNISANVSNIDSYQIFSSVREFTADSTNAFFSAYDGALFNREMTTLRFYPSGSPSTEWTLPESVKCLENYCVSAAANLRTLKITEKPQYISAQAFNDCTRLFISFNGEMIAAEEFRQ